MVPPLCSDQPAYSPVRTCGDGWHRVRIPKYFLAIHLLVIKVFMSALPIPDEDIPSPLCVHSNGVQTE